MKLASYQDGSRDGQLVVVSRDLRQAHFANGIATRLQQVLDDWAFMAPQLEELSISLNQNRLRHAFDFDPARCTAPLPRAFGYTVPEDGGWRASDAFSGPTAPLRLAASTLGVGLVARLAVITGDLNRSAEPATALDAIRLLLLAAESPFSTAFAPVAVTLDELGPAWATGAAALPIQAMHNGLRLEAEEAPGHPFGELLSQRARHRPLRAGLLVGSAVRARVAAPLAFGDAIRFEVKTADGESLFGAIDQDISELP